MLQDIATIELRYQQFIERVAATKLVWALMSKQGWANSHAQHDEEVGVVPFWADRALAKVCARDDWRSFVPTEIPLADFLENWCVGMAENGTLAGINWNATMIGKEIDTLNVALDILNRLKAINSAITFKNYGSLDDFIADISEEPLD